MKGARSITNAVLSLLLVISLLLSLCSCGFSAGDIKEKASDIGNKIGNAAKTTLSKSGVILSDATDAIVKAYGSAKESAIYVYDEAATLTAVGYEKASAKAIEVVGDVAEYVAALKQKDESEPDVWAKGDPNKPIKDLSKGASFNETNALVIDNTFDTEQFVTYYISTILDARGYEVYNGAVYYKGDIYGGLIFTKGDIFVEENGQKIQSCGFVQLVSDGYTGVKITDSMVQSGLIAVASDSDSSSFIVEEYAVFDDFSGIYNDTYFLLQQLDHYVLSISIRENEKKNYESKVELYDFDNDQYINKPGKEEDVERVFVENNLAFQGAATTVNAIVDVGENTTDDLATVFVMDGNTLDALLSKAAAGAETVTDFIAGAVKGTKLGNSQYLSIDSNGKSHILGTKNDEDETRLTNGIITTVSSGLAAAGAVASIVCVAHAGTVVVTAIVITTGTCAIVYNVSNIIAGSQDIYYGAKSSTKETENPVLNLFKAAIPDEQTATLVYHIWGASNTILSTIMMPVSKALNIAKVKSLNSFQTAVGVVRASITTVAKAAATGVGAGVVANYVSKVASKVSGNENIGKLAGFGACLVTGFLVYQGLDAVDKNLDVSGLYPKAYIKPAFVNAKQGQTQQILKIEDISKQRRGYDEKLINNLVEKAQDYYGIETKPNIKIVYDGDLSDCGSYDVISDTLTINMRASEHQSLAGLADTVGHEMRHVWQWGEGYTDEMANSLLNYIQPTPQNYSAYCSQLCEADAFAAGREFVDFILALSLAA